MTALTPRAAGWRLALFAVVAGAVLITIMATIRPLGTGTGHRSLRADFVSASDLAPGDDVRTAGVRVGTVQAVSVLPDGLARVVFDVENDLPVTTRTRFEIRYLDLAGNRYLAVVPGSAAAQAAPRLNGGEVIGTARTAPALDINDLLAGFKPLLTGLQPEQINQLSLEIVRTLQGDGPTVRRLIQRTASLTSTLADRGRLIGQVIGNLDAVVGTVADRHTQLEQLVAALRSFADGLAADRDSVGRAIAHIDRMSGLTADLLRRTRPSIRHDLERLRQIVTTLASATGRAAIDHALAHLPDKLARLSATASYGSWFNYYVCGVRVVVRPDVAALDPALTRALEQIHLVDSASRCDP